MIAKEEQKDQLSQGLKAREGRPPGEKEFVKGLLQGLIQTNPCVIGGGWNGTCYCYVVVIVGNRAMLVFFSLPLTET